MKYYLFTLGCQMNVSDSERIATKLENIGYKSAPEKEADLVVVNACSVRQKAVDRIWGKIKRWQKARKKILITGCVLKNDQKKLAHKGINFFKISDLPKINKTLIQNFNTAKYGSFALNYYQIEPKLIDKTVYIPIMTGCDNFCSYCVVPYTRGREISRPMKDIIADAKVAIDNNCKEIWLLGQNVNSYGKKGETYHLNRSSVKSRTTIREEDNRDFMKLLKRVDSLPGDFKFNFMSSNPQDMSDKIIGTFAKLKKWPRELHLAMQSGDDEILRKMNRKYTHGQFLTLIENLKFKIKNLKLSTDIIVGFPSETKKQFENTVKICKKIGFEKAYISQYSPRPGTAAAKLKDNISPAEKKRRWLKLEKLINKK